MILLAVVDDRNGMMFNNRRQSQDRVMRERICELSAGSRLWMNQYSYKLFIKSETPANIMVDDNFLALAGADDLCFVENTDIHPYTDRIKKIILFKWNRAYPGDTFFPMDLGEWKLVYTEEFAGSSHEKITVETYVR